MNKKRVIWWNPYWAHCPAAQKKWALLLNRYSVLCVVAMACSLVAVMAIGIKQIAPQADTLGLLSLLVQIPAIFGLVYLYAIVDRCIPARVVMKEDRFVVQRGEAVAIVYFKDVAKLRVVVFAEKMLRLSIRFHSKAGLRTLRIGLPAELNLKEFLDNFACEKKVLDARDLFGKFSKESLKLNSPVASVSKNERS